MVILPFHHDQREAIANGPCKTVGFRDSAYLQKPKRRGKTWHCSPTPSKLQSALGELKLVPVHSENIL